MAHVDQIDVWTKWFYSVPKRSVAKIVGFTTCLKEQLPNDFTADISETMLLTPMVLVT